MRQVLIVEDEVVFRRSVSFVLAERGIEVRQAGSLSEAHEALLSGHFDAFLLDVGLPDGDGLSLFEHTDPKRSLVMTARPEPDRFERCGVIHHVEKPLDLNALANRVISLFDA